jgi:putative esterase
MRPRKLLVFLLLPVLATLAYAQPSQHLFFRVTLGAKMQKPVSGRLLIFVQKGNGAQSIDVNEFHPTDTHVAAKEISDLCPGASLEIDMDDLVFPSPLSSLQPGDYQAQAVLDIDHSYNYSGRRAGDLVSAVVPLSNWTPGQGSEPVFELNSVAHEPSQRSLPLSPEEVAKAEQSIELQDLVSPVLTKFFGRETHLRAWVVLPPGYREHTREHYPTVYWTHGFGGTLSWIKRNAYLLSNRMASGKMPPMIWVMLDESLPTGTHEFADSRNNGPWGTALTTEFIPYLESKYRMDARTNGRFLQGHSSGGWATLQLQISYPRIFGGTWSTSPDSSDFHDFTGVDLYAPHANMYHRADGTPYPLIRDHQQVLATLEQFAKLEHVLGDYGGQFASFEWVFSPRGADGRPLEVFDRKTGDIDPAVVSYWHDHYDLAHIVAANWPTLKPDLKGKIHLFVGTADTFYLDGAAHKLEAVLKSLNADPHFTYRENRTHSDLYVDGNDPMALFDQIAAEMYAVARPSAKRP